MNILKENNFSKFVFNDYILIITIKKSQPNDKEWLETINLTKSFYELSKINNYNFSIIFDLRLMGILSYNRIKEWSDLFIKYKDNTKKYVTCSSIITNSFIIKNSLNIFFSIYTTVKPMKMVDNLNDALNFIKENL